MSHYEGIIYFAGAKSRWAGKVAEDEVIARVTSRYRWFARWLTRSAHAHLDPTRCGYIVRRDAATFEHVEARS